LASAKAGVDADKRVRSVKALKRGAFKGLGIWHAGIIVSSI
jgi:hypothetical protein